MVPTRTGFIRAVITSSCGVLQERGSFFRCYQKVGVFRKPARGTREIDIPFHHLSSVNPFS
jgi:hypothetical protein